MVVKPRNLPHDRNDIIDILIGDMPLAALAALISHSLGMDMKWCQRY
jgi:hypothetical protein